MRGSRREEAAGLDVGQGPRMGFRVWAQPQSEQPPGKVRVRSGTVGQLLTEPEACFFVYIFCGDFLGKGSDIILTIITYIDKRKLKH